ncbi:MAG: ATP-binding protein [bacterium]
MTVVVAVVVGVLAVTVGFLLGRRAAARRNTAPATPAESPPALLAAVSRRPVIAAASGDVDSAQMPALVVEALGEGVVVVDRDDVVLLANPAARALGALDGDRLVVADLRELARTAQDERAVLTRTVELTRGWLGLEVVVVSAAAVPIIPPDSPRAIAVALLLTDTTEARRLEAVRRDFVANVSHELKTPVGALTLLAEAVQDAADDPVAVQRFAARMQHEGQRLGRLVGELVALSRVQGADVRPELAPVLVEDVIDEAMDRTRLRANDVGITLSSSVTDGLTVLGDEDQLATAVANLVDNAVSYSPDGTRVVITGRATDAPAGASGGSWVEIAVTDQGMGISEADIERIFERFYRVDPARSRATGGTGLGLSIVKHVITNHGGTIDIWSAEGAGSTFTVRLPEAPVPGATPAGSDDAAVRDDVARGTQMAEAPRRDVADGSLADPAPADPALADPALADSGTRGER